MKKVSMKKTNMVNSLDVNASVVLCMFIQCYLYREKQNLSDILQAGRLQPTVKISPLNLEGDGELPAKDPSP